MISMRNTFNCFFNYFLTVELVLGDTQYGHRNRWSLFFWRWLAKGNIKCMAAAKSARAKREIYSSTNFRKPDKKSVTECLSLTALRHHPSYYSVHFEHLMYLVGLSVIYDRSFRFTLSSVQILTFWICSRLSLTERF